MSDIRALKITDKKSGHTTIYKIEQLPCTIGRSIRNDIIINDDSISASHASIEESDHGLLIRDLNSTNGISYNHEKINTLPLTENTFFNLGSVQVEFLCNDDKLDTTRVVINPFQSSFQKTFMEPMNRKDLAIMFSLMFGAFLLDLFDSYLSFPLDKKKFAETVSQFLAVIFASLFAAGILSFVSKIHSKTYRYVKFMKIISIYYFAIIFVTIIEPPLLFHCNSRTFSTIWTYVILSSLGFSFLYFLLKAIQVSKKTIFAIIIGWFVGFAGMKYITKQADKNVIFNSHDMTIQIFYPLKSYDAESYPESELFDEIDDAITEVNEFREKKRKEREYIE